MPEKPKIRSMGARHRGCIGFLDEHVADDLRKFMPFVGSAGPDGLPLLAFRPPPPNTSLWILDSP
jgi:hypothetical protein